jgi:multiple sugar transport system permease protein
MFIGPAALIIFLFGLFPVAFAFFVSLHRWRRFPDEFQGLDNYVDAVGNLAYVSFFWIAIAMIGFGLYSAWRVYRRARKADDWRKLAYLLPGFSLAASLIGFLNWFFILLPIVFDVPRRLRGQQLTTELFIAELGESFLFEAPLAAADIMLATFAISTVLLAIFLLWVRTKDVSDDLLISARAATGIIAGVLLMNLTLAEVQSAVEAARAAEESVPVWSQIIFISLGVGLLGGAIYLWQTTVEVFSDRQFWLRGLMVVLAVVGGVLLIMFLPPALSNADDDVLQGFSVTTMYALFSVPLQLIFGLALAVLLYQEIRFKSFFRVVYFLPYITPFVATSVVFALLFSHRTGSPINQLLVSLNIEPQNWLLEPTGIFQLLFGDVVPDLLAGPGLALMVIILYNVWIFAGYSTVIFLAGLGNIDPKIYEAAQIDGANGWQQFRYMTLPLLSPTTFFLILIATIGTFQAFTQVFLMRRPGAYDAVDTVNLYIYNEIQTTSPDYAYGSAMAFVLFGVLLVLTLIQNRVAERRVFYG